MKVVLAEQVCFVCPSAWDVVTDAGDYLYLKYRSGMASVWRELGDRLVLVTSVAFGGPLDGWTTLEKFARVVGFELALEAPYEPLPDPNEGYDWDSIPAWLP